MTWPTYSRNLGHTHAVLASSGRLQLVTNDIVVFIVVSQNVLISNFTTVFSLYHVFGDVTNDAAVCNSGHIVELRSKLPHAVLKKGGVLNVPSCSLKVRFTTCVRWPGHFSASLLIH